MLDRVEEVVDLEVREGPRLEGGAVGLGEDREGDDVVGVVAFRQRQPRSPSPRTPRRLPLSTASARPWSARREATQRGGTGVSDAVRRRGAPAAHTLEIRAICILKGTT